jgi:catechol 2,3-dioxygenase-like lactoylglutathione lyase family enzyme
MQILSIDHVQLAIPPGGEADARRFYGDLLGLRELPKPEAMRARGGVWFDAGAFQIHLGIEPNMRPSSKVHAALVVTDLAGWMARLVAAGCEWKEADDYPGVRRGHTKDPAGNRLELIEAASGSS